MFLMVCSLSACGENNSDKIDTPTNKSHVTEQSKDNNNSSSDVSISFDKTFDFYGYSVAYTNDCITTERTGGMTVTRNSDFWIVYSTLALFGDEFTVEGLSGITDK